MSWGGSLSRTVSLVITVLWDPKTQTLCSPEPGIQGVSPGLQLQNPGHWIWIRAFLQEMLALGGLQREGIKIALPSQVPGGLTVCPWMCVQVGTCPWGCSYEHKLTASFTERLSCWVCGFCHAHRLQSCGIHKHKPHWPTEPGEGAVFPGSSHKNPDARGVYKLLPGR